MKKKTTIYDIAVKLNITAATVSRALNNNSKISEATRELVQKTALKMNYEQNKVALALKSGKSYNVGVIVPRIDTTFFGSVIRAIEEELYPAGYHVIICQTHDIESREVENITTLINAQVDGILMSISSPDIDLNVINQIVKKNIPLIFFDRKKDIEGVSSVVINDFEGGYKVTKQLIEQGCKKIVHINGNPKIKIFQERCRGYKHALKDSGLAYDEKLVFETKSNVEEGRRVAKLLLAMDTLPDGVFSSSDFTALGVIQELKENGVKIPEDICVAGFANEPFTKFMELSITSVDQSPLEMGKMTAKVFLEQVNNKEIKIEKKVVLEPKLMIRKSSLRKVISK
ncbi:LacI family transcriptional regulator [Lutibacter sp. HS1-25]|uniref:LacI family DNA-binding transcriptional regulator n=1 Tax=Lutibacter sp. HS1-25 TaxID=2485000 RepID=UPI001011AA32|nr:LacI family DNA-binding transcriptional regulator [Lutibacter sp. HS1-25]RXP46891.1 LacI family transcriptional regulator [Lutibacter sp. HS1-25]